MRGSAFQAPPGTQMHRRSAVEIIEMCEPLPALDIDALPGSYDDNDPHDAESYGAIHIELLEALLNWYHQQRTIDALCATQLAEGIPLNHLRQRSLYAEQDAILRSLSPDAFELLTDRGEFHIGDGVLLAWVEYPGVGRGGGLVARSVFDLSGCAS